MPSSSQAFLRLDRLQFAYRALPAVNGVNWCWNRGEQWACIGPNGAGKTTLASLISGQLDWGSGDLERSEQLQQGG